MQWLCFLWLIPKPAWLRIGRWYSLSIPWVARSTCGEKTDPCGMGRITLAFCMLLTLKWEGSWDSCLLWGWGWLVLGWSMVATQRVVLACLEEEDWSKGSIQVLPTKGGTSEQIAVNKLCKLQRQVLQQRNASIHIPASVLLLLRFSITYILHIPGKLLSYASSRG